MTYYDRVKDAADAVRSRIATIPQVAIVLGSGLGDFANSIGSAVTMPYGGLPHWPASRVIGHEGKLVVGTAAGKTIVARHMKMDVLGISCITNMAAGVLPQPIDHVEVMETGRRIRGQFIALLEGIIEQL